MCERRSALFYMDPKTRSKIVSVLISLVILLGGKYVLPTCNINIISQGNYLLVHDCKDVCMAVFLIFFIYIYKNALQMINRFCKVIYVLYIKSVYTRLDKQYT